jgi:hypothetical protein
MSNNKTSQDTIDSGALWAIDDDFSDRMYERVIGDKRGPQVWNPDIGLDPHGMDNVQFCLQSAINCSKLQIHRMQKYGWVDLEKYIYRCCEQTGLAYNEVDTTEWVDATVRGLKSLQQWVDYAEALIECRMDDNVPMPVMPEYKIISEFADDELQRLFWELVACASMMAYRLD